MEFSPQSKIWIYTSNRLLNSAETELINKRLNDFVNQWQAHGHALKAQAMVLHRAFIVLMVDEDQAAATGCSIDSSVRMLKEIDAAYNLDLFNRFNLSYRTASGEVALCDRSQFEELIQQGVIQLDTPVFNNMVQNYEAFQSGWEVPLHQSWHQNIFKIPVS